MWVEKIKDFIRSELDKRYLADQALKAKIQQCEARRRELANEISELESLLEKAIVVIDKGNRVVEVNAAVEQVTGYPSRFLVGKSLSRLVQAEVFNEFAEKAASGENFEVWFSVPKRGGTGLYQAVQAEVVVRDDYTVAILKKFYDYVLSRENGQEAVCLIADEVVDLEKCKNYLAAVLDWTIKGKKVQIDFRNVKKFRSAAIAMIYRFRHLFGDFSKVFKNFPIRRYEAVVEIYKKLLERIELLEEILSSGDYGPVLKRHFQKLCRNYVGPHATVEEGLRSYISIERDELVTFAKKISKVEKADIEIEQKREVMLKGMFNEQYKIFNKLYRDVLRELLLKGDEKPPIVSLGTLTDPPSVNGKSYRAFAKYCEKKEGRRVYHVLVGYELESVKSQA